MKFLKLGIVIVIIVVSFINLNAQIGIEFIGNSNKYQSWNDVIYEFSENESKIFKYSYGGGVNYWFRLQNNRLEFTPGVYYLYSDFNFSESKGDFKYTAHTIGIEFDANLYPFDFVRRTYERDCPSFSNGNDWLKKSFFIQVSPGLFGVMRSIQNGERSLEKNYIAGKFDFGIGVDMKLGSHIIVAPIIKYGFSIGEKWNGFSEFHSADSFNDITTNTYLSFVLVFYLK